MLQGPGQINKQYINQPIKKLTEPVKFYTKLGSPEACAGFFTGGQGSTMSKLDKQKILHVYIVFILRINTIYRAYRPIR